MSALKKLSFLLVLEQDTFSLAHTGVYKRSGRGGFPGAQLADRTRPQCPAARPERPRNVRVPCDVVRPRVAGLRSRRRWSNLLITYRKWWILYSNHTAARAVRSQIAPTRAHRHSPQRSQVQYIRQSHRCFTVSARPAGRSLRIHRFIFAHSCRVRRVADRQNNRLFPTEEPES